MHLNKLIRSFASNLLAAESSHDQCWEIRAKICNSVFNATQDCRFILYQTKMQSMLDSSNLFDEICVVVFNFLVASFVSIWGILCCRSQLSVVHRSWLLLWPCPVAAQVLTHKFLTSPFPASIGKTLKSTDLHLEKRSVSKSLPR